MFNKSSLTTSRSTTARLWMLPSLCSHRSRDALKVLPSAAHVRGPLMFTPPLLLPRDLSACPLQSLCSCQPKSLHLPHCLLQAAVCLTAALSLHVYEQLSSMTTTMMYKQCQGCLGSAAACLKGPLLSRERSGLSLPAAQVKKGLTRPRSLSSQPTWWRTCKPLADDKRPSARIAHGLSGSLMAGLVAEIEGRTHESNAVIGVDQLLGRLSVSSAPITRAGSSTFQNLEDRCVIHLQMTLMLCIRCLAHLMLHLMAVGLRSLQ